MFIIYRVLHFCCYEKNSLRKKDRSFLAHCFNVNTLVVKFPALIILFLFFLDHSYMQSKGNYLVCLLEEKPLLLTVEQKQTVLLCTEVVYKTLPEKYI
jgi:hypothetical protein